MRGKLDSSGMKSAGYLRTELVLNLHSGCNVFPSTSATSFPVTSSRLDDSSDCTTLSTRLTESDLGKPSVFVARCNDDEANGDQWRLVLTHRLVQAQMLYRHSSPNFCPLWGSPPCLVGLWQRSSTEPVRTDPFLGKSSALAIKYKRHPSLSPCIFIVS